MMENRRWARREEAFPTIRGPNGEKYCSLCKKIITAKRRFRWCSNECSTEAGIRTSPSVARWHVKKRDKGICAKCGFDSKKFNRHKTEEKNILMEMGYNPNRALWEMHHKIPVKAGGGLCELDNYETLCQKCHDETKKKPKNEGKEKMKQDGGQGRLI